VTHVTAQNKSQRRYYAFRRQLEKRYPQMCPECEPRVAQRVQQAGYTAKTDHLRRMMDRSRKSRFPALTTWSTLRAFDMIGWALWCGGYMFQLAWHAACIARAVEDQSLDDARWMRAAWWAFWVGRFIPVGHWGGISVWAAAFGIWWNPEWIKVFNGFSKHILHLPQWYASQLIIITIRALAWMSFGNIETDIATISGDMPRLTGVAVISGHLAISFLTSLVNMTIALHFIYFSTGF